MPRGVPVTGITASLCEVPAFGSPLVVARDWFPVPSSPAARPVTR